METSALWEMEFSCHQPWEWFILESGPQSVPVKSSDHYSCQIADPMLKHPGELSSSSCYLLSHRIGEDPVHLFSPPIQVARKTSRCSQEHSGWPMRFFSRLSKVWGLSKTFCCSDLLLGVLGCWDPNSCLDQTGTEILCCQTLGICSQFAGPAAYWLQHSLPLEKELWLGYMERGATSFLDYHLSLDITTWSLVRSDSPSSKCSGGLWSQPTLTWIIWFWGGLPHHTVFSQCLELHKSSLETWEMELIFSSCWFE